MPLSQDPRAIAARNRRAAAAASRTNVELIFATRAVAAARTALEEARRPRVYTTPPSTNPSAVRSRASRLAARIDLANYALSQAEARLARATNPPAPPPARARRAPRRPPAAAPFRPPAQDGLRFDTAIEKIYDMADAAVNAGRGGAQINISVVRRSVSLTGRWSEPYTEVYSRIAQELHERGEDLVNTILYRREGYVIVSISASTGQRVVGVRRFQVYLDGPKHCILAPIIELFERKIENSESDKRRSEITALVNKAKAMSCGVYVNGIPQDQLQKVCQDLRVAITIHTPCQEDSKAQVFTPRGQPVVHAKFHNVSLNHVESHITMNNLIPVSRERLCEVYEELRHTKAYYEYARWGCGITWLRTAHGKYTLENKMLEFVRSEERRWGVRRLCAIKEPELTAYIKSAYVTPGHCDMRDTSAYARSTPDGTIIPGIEGYSCYDMTRAFTQGHTNPCYSRYPGSITNFGRTSVERGVGFYTLVDIVLTDQVRLTNKAFGGVFVDGAVYATPWLRYLDMHGCTYKITHGAWGKAIDLDFSDPLWNTREHDTAPPLYSYTIGTWAIASTKETFYVHGDDVFLRHVAAVNEGNSTISIFHDQSELSVTRQRESAPHLLHDAAFVTAYVEIAMLLQYEVMDPHKVLRAGCDCFYTTEKDVKLTDCFREKKGELLKTNIASDRYMLVKPCECNPTAEYIERGDMELHRGPGGSGKTWNVCRDKSLVRLLVVTPSHKLAAELHKKHGVRTAVVAQVTTDVPTFLEYVNWANWVCIDECYQNSKNIQSKITARFGHTANIVWCGDNCQLPHYQEEGKPTEPFDESIFPSHAIIEYTENHRCKCDVLGPALKDMRANIERGYKCAQIARTTFKTITRRELADRYDSLSWTILTHTKVSREAYTSMLKAAGKPDRFRVMTRVGEHYNGSIVWDIVAPLTEANTELQHASTVHSCQGLEIPTGCVVAIDQSALSGKDGRMAYTAASRAQTASQIVLIVNDEETVHAPRINEICRFTETASADKAKWLLERTEQEMDMLLDIDDDEWYKGEVREFGKAYADARRETNRRISRSNLISYCNRVVSNGGTLQMGYKYSTENREDGRAEGRLQGDGACMQRIPGSARGFFLGDTDVIDVDMCNAHPCMALKVARHHGLEVPCLERYVTDRAAVLRENNMIKQDALIMLNREKRVADATEYVMALDAELKLLQNTVWDSPEYDYKRTRRPKPDMKLKGSKLKVKRDENYNLKGSYLNKLFCDMENKLLQRAVAYLNPELVHGLYFDGLMVKGGSVDIEALNALTADHGIKWAVKPHCTRFKELIEKHWTQ